MTPPASTDRVSPTPAEEVSSVLAELDALAAETTRPLDFCRSAMRLGSRVLDPLWAGVLTGFYAERPVIVSHWPLAKRVALENDDLLAVAAWSAGVGHEAPSSIETLRGREALLVRIGSPDQVSFVLVYTFGAKIPADARPGLIRLGNRLAAAGSRAESNAATRKASEDRKAWARFGEVAKAANRDAPLKDLATELVDAGAAYTRCGRVSITLRRGKRQRVIAVSGLERFAQRSEAIKSLEAAASAVCRTGRPCFFSGVNTDLAPQLDEALEAYAELGGAKSIAVFPLVRESRSNRRNDRLGTVVLERFEDPGVDQATEEAVRFAQVAEVSLARAVRMRSVPGADRLLRIADRGRWFTGGWAIKWGAVAATIAGLAAAAVLVPGDLTVDARGELMPKELQHVFAPHDGRVESVHVAHGEQVAAGASFVTIASSELSLQIEKAVGEIEIAEEELLQVQTAAYAETGGAESLQRSRELSARESLLESQLEHLKTQLGLLEEQADLLKVAAPRGGSVITWDIEKTLAAHPVRRGDLLGSIANLDGAWRLELRVPDRLVGHVLAERESAGGLPSLSFILATDPQEVYEAQAVRMSPSSQFDPHANESYVTLEADFVGDAPPRPRLGAAVKARLRCGREPLYYVWFHEAYEAVRRYFF